MSKQYDPLHGKTLPVFLHYAIPSVGGLLASSSASMIDAMFLGNYVGAEALAAVNLTVPATSLLYAVVFMLAVGGSVIAGKFLGENNDAAASDIFTKTMAAACAVSLLIAVPSIVFIRQLVQLLGATEALSTLVVQYLQILLLFSPALVVSITLYYFIIVDGHPIHASASLIAGSVINVLLDWLFIAELEKGVTGAALATGLSQLSVMFFLLPYMFRKQARLKLARLQGSWKQLFRAAVNGISEFTNEMSVGTVTLLFNWIMITRLGTDGVAAFTIVQYLLFIAVMICYGFAESLQPLVSKNLGARQPHRIRAFLTTAMLSSLTVGIVISIALLTFPQTLIALFLKEGEIQTGSIALSMIALFWPAFLFNGMNITLTSYFTSLHKPVASAVISLSRSLVLPAVLLLSIPPLLGTPGVYICVPIAELLTFIIGIVLLKRHKLST